MLKSSSAAQNAERAKQAANYGMAWMRQFMDESLNQTRAIFDGFLTTPRPTVLISKRRRSGNDPCPWQRTRSRILWILRIGL